jgi:pseudouridine synthase
MDLIGKAPVARVYPVGRLDYNTEGLLLLTNDGELAYRFQHPRYRVSRVYEVKVKGVPAAEALSRLRKGIPLEDGVALPAKVIVKERTMKNCWLKVTVYEGKNRLVRRMCEAIGHPAVKLKRVRIGPIGLGSVERGGYRYLTKNEVSKLHKTVSL